MRFKELTLYELLTTERIREGVARLAEEIRFHYDGKDLMIVGVMTGSVVFLADLIRQLDRRVHVSVVHARSYRGDSRHPSNLSIHSDMLPEIRGRQVLVLDDIFDTGQTLFELITRLDEFRPDAIRSAVLLRKECTRSIRMEPSHVGFDIPNVFVVGYGLDYRGEYRNLSHIAVLEDGDLEAT